MLNVSPVNSCMVWPNRENIENFKNNTFFSSSRISLSQAIDGSIIICYYLLKKSIFKMHSHWTLSSFSSSSTNLSSSISFLSSSSSPLSSSSHCHQYTFYRSHWWTKSNPSLLPPLLMWLDECFRKKNFKLSSTKRTILLRMFIWLQSDIPPEQRLQVSIYQFSERKFVVELLL